MALTLSYPFPSILNPLPIQPDGGVEEGQIFLAPLPVTFAGERLKAPTGHWKDSFYDLCNAGACHSSLWCSLCCAQIAMGQVVSRMQLTWLGEPGTLYSTRKSFTVIVALVCSYMIYSTALELASMPYAVGQGPAILPLLKFFGMFMFSVWSLYALCRTRENVRARYQIPEEYCKGCEDICCSIFCSCCAAAQLLRHTGEYEMHPGTCCTKTGHPPGTPLVV